MVKRHQLPHKARLLSQEEGFALEHDLDVFHEPAEEGLEWADINMPDDSCLLRLEDFQPHSIEGTLTKKVQ